MSSKTDPKNTAAGCLMVLVLLGAAWLWWPSQAAPTLLDIASDEAAARAFPWLQDAAANCSAYREQKNEIQKTRIYRHHLDGVARTPFTRILGVVDRISILAGGRSALVQIQSHGLALSREVGEEWMYYDVLASLEKGDCVELTGFIIEPDAKSEERAICGLAYHARIGSLRPCDSDPTSEASGPSQ